MSKLSKNMRNRFSNPLDMRKRIFQRILANFISVVTVEEWKILAHNNINVYEFFLKESPDLFSQFQGDGIQAGLTKIDVRKYCNEEGITETLQNHLPHYLDDIISNGNLDWLHVQLEYILTNVVG